ncbi:PAS domain-containing protein [Uliginosibacterium sp. H3]|uniref:histidine kinase n=1 Tax=Uliginosibacterium silvisoli TaxID=3114758 RepID=A0ABU6K040_9RHOO|nr:PAS domain-containing protein [Uliginosibacterium sp. H3]
MGARIRSFDWASGPLGPIESWPTGLRVAVDLMLASRFPTCLFWGPDLIAIYNDSFIPILGQKPEALGQPLRITWSEAWADLKPITDKALAGESTFIENFLVPVARRGFIEDAWFTFCYSPVFDEHGNVAGMLDTVVETTEKVLSERQSRQDSERQQALLAQMPGFACLLSGPEHVFAYVNDAYIKLVGPRELIGRSVREAFPELQGQGYYERLDRVFSTGKGLSVSANPVRLDQQPGERFVDLIYEPIRDENGVVTGIFVGGYDVTDRVVAETSLRELNIELERRVVERTLARGRAWQVSPEMLCVINADGYFELTNPAWESTLGWTEAEMASAPYTYFVHPEDIEPSHRAWIDASERGLPVLRFENRYRTKTGNYRWLSWVAVPEDGKVYCITRDVQEEKEHAAALAERTAERDVLAEIVGTTDAFIQVLDLDYCFLAINKANVNEYERVFGVRPAVGDNLLALLDNAAGPRDRENARALWGRAMAGESFTEQDEFGDPSLDRRYYEMRFEVLRDKFGVQIGAFMMSTDITERLREQRELLSAQEALRQAQKMEAVGQLTGGIAHDFNNLLAAISGSLQLIKVKLERGNTAGIDRYIDMSENSVRRASALTQRLLAFSRRQTLDPKPTDINRLMSGMEELVRRTVGPSVEVEVRGADSLWATKVDAPQLENALLNLCINARDAMPQGGKLAIETANRSLDERAARERELPPGEYVSLSVTDTGSGIPPDLVKRIFDPFFTTKPLGQGTGLGLSMVYGFVRQSGGQVRVDSALGRGTTMCIYLPRHIGNADESEENTSARLVATGDDETILLIEDEETIRSVMTEVLGEAGYRVLSAPDGPSGLRILQGAGRIDLLITDVGLPGGLNGRQVADAGREHRPELKVLFITGYAETVAVGNGLMAHGMQVMTKPFEIAGLANKVREMLDGA